MGERASTGDTPHQERRHRGIKGKTACRLVKSTSPR